MSVLAPTMMIRIGKDTAIEWHRAVLRSLPLRRPTLPPRRPTLKNSLRAIERAFADIAGIAMALSDNLRVAERNTGRKVVWSKN